LRGRFHPELATANVAAANIRSIGFDPRATMGGTAEWRRIIARNQLFQKIAISRLLRLVQSERPRTVFAYSYAASGLGQVGNRVLWCVRVGRWRGIFQGLVLLPVHAWKQRAHRRPVPPAAFRAKRRARKAALRDF
jgi:hypothetical protein